MRRILLYSYLVALQLFLASPFRVSLAQELFKPIENDRSRIRLAVLGLQAREGIPSTYAERAWQYLTIELRKQGWPLFTVLERKKIEQLREELDWEQVATAPAGPGKGDVAAFDPQFKARVGKLKGLDYALFGVFFQGDTGQEMCLELEDVETAEVVWNVIRTVPESHKLRPLIRDTARSLRFWFECRTKLREAKMLARMGRKRYAETLFQEVIASEPHDDMAAQALLEIIRLELEQAKQDLDMERFGVVEDLCDKLIRRFSRRPEARVALFYYAQPPYLRLFPDREMQERLFRGKKWSRPITLKERSRYRDEARRRLTTFLQLESKSRYATLAKKQLEALR